MIFEFLSTYSALLIIHMIGVIIGFGGAIMSDLIFFSSIRDGEISDTEMRFIKLGSRAVWAGVFIIVCSGIFLFLTDPAGYLASGKFLAKMTIVAVVILNGIVFHFVHIPSLSKTIGHPFRSSPDFLKGSSLLFASGAVSSTSWLFAFVLGFLRSVPFAYGAIMALYALILGLAIGTAIVLRKRIFSS